MVTCVSTDSTRHVTIPAGRERWQRYPQQHAIGTVDLRIAPVNALAAPVQNLHGAKFGLEPFAEPQFELRRRFVDRAAYTRYRMVQKSMRRGERGENQC